MALDVYFQDDLAHGIMCSVVAMYRAHVANGGVNAEWFKGVLAMAESQALLYGLPWPKLRVQIEERLER
ncbi:MAG TPA: hypothetical protein VM537_15660 [Anaerolineae bacterium]|nr:hypothetical protein [Anaerolineae bacterium]